MIWNRYKKLKEDITDLKERVSSAELELQKLTDGSKWYNVNNDARFQLEWVYVIRTAFVRVRFRGESLPENIVSNKSIVLKKDLIHYLITLPQK